MNGQLSLDLETAGENRKRFHETARERPIAGQDVGEGAAEHVGDKAGQQPVAGAMAGAIGRLLAIDAGRHHHVEPLLDELCDHRRRARRVVGRVAVHQDVNIRFDVIEHPPHHVALALVGLAANHGARPPRGLDSAVGGIVVIDVDGRLGQRRTEIGDDLGDGALLIVTRHQNRHLIAGFRLRFRQDVRCLTLPFSAATSLA